ncbi:MAG: crotonase/enoyl-CoA hydratase family protein [Actinobacteria bacterium]|nr:crotonase/enoyl-CoA hydratase family protein [Actinomycetota bacterium]
MSAGPAVTVQDSDGVTVITINRPEARNAVNAAVARGVAAALDDLDASPELRAGVITGAGGTFSAGMDLKGFLAGENPTEGGRGFGGIVTRPPAKPVVAAVEGYALAGGFEIALACDLIVASETAQFGLPEVTRGLVAAAGGLLRLPARIPYHLAMEIALTGDRFPASRLQDAGLVSRLVPAGEALAEATRLAARIAANAPLALAATKRIVAESRDWPSAEAFRRQDEISGPVFGSADAIEGAAAFAEKRAPVWRGE